MCENQEKPSEVFEREYPESRIAGLIIPFLKKYQFKELLPFYVDKKGHFEIYKINLKSKEIKWLLKEKIVEKEEENPDYKIKYVRSFVYSSIYNMLLDETNPERGVHKIIINDEIIEELRLETGRPDLEITKDNIDIIKQVPGYHHSWIDESGNNLFITENDKKEKFENMVNRIESLHGGYKEKGELVYIKRNNSHDDISQEEKVILKTKLDLFLKNLTLREKEIWCKYFLEGETQEEIGKDYEISTSRVNQIIDRLNKQWQDIYNE